MNPRVNLVLRRFLSALADGKYVEIEKMTHGKHMSAKELKQAVEMYGRRIVMPPDSVLPQLLDVIAAGGRGTEYSVWLDLYTEEEGRSDLAAMLRICERPDGAGVDLELEDIRVP